MNKDEMELETLKNILDTLPNNVYWKDKNGRYRWLNKSTVDLLRSQHLIFDSIVGKTDFDVFPEKYAIEYAENDKKVMAEGKGMSIEEEVILPNGKTLTQLSFKEPLYDQKSEKVIGVLGYTIDISDRKLAERAKSEFIANMSHDIRTPITGMIGMIQDLLNTVEETRKELEKARVKMGKNTFNRTKQLTSHIENDGHVLMDSTNELLQLCNEILEVTQLNNGIFNENAKSFDLYELIKHNIDLLAPVARNKKIILEVDIEKKLPRYLTGLKEYTNRTLLNLLSNALKFTNKGYVRLKVLTIKDHEKKYIKGENVTIQFIIEDTGIGIPEDKFDVIFEHFSRLTPSYEGLYKGSGLGLYTVKRYVEAMSGHIELKSKVGEGTCFTITLPFIVSDKLQEPKQSIKRSAQKPTSGAKKIGSKILTHKQSETKGTAARVLLVEDNLIAAMALNLALKSFNCFVDIANSAKDAIKKATENRYNLILMDVGLPDCSGVEAARIIRSLTNHENSTVPIIAITGHAANSERAKECFDAGMQEVFSKPVSDVELESIFQKYIFSREKLKDQESAHVSFAQDGIDEKIFNVQASVEIIGDEESAWRMLDILCKDLPHDVGEIKKAQKKNDLKRLLELFHKLIGGLGYLKTPQLESATIELHNGLKVKPLSEMQESFKNFYLATDILFEAYYDFKKK